MAVRPPFLRGPLLATAFVLSAAVSAETRLAVFRGAPQNSGMSSAIPYSNPGVKTFVEQWLLTAHLRDGGLLTVLFLVHNAGPGTGYAGVVVRLIEPGGKKNIDKIGRASCRE